MDIQRGGQAAISRSLYIMSGTAVVITLADDDPTLTTDTDGGPQTYTLPGTPILLPFNARRVHSTGAVGSPVVKALF